MNLAVNVSRIAPRLLAFRFQPSVLRAFVLATAIGTYILTVGVDPIHVGRSDQSLLNRLLSHPLMGQASHFLWELSTCATCGYRRECFWFHGLRNNWPLVNMGHPAKPKLSTESIQFCIADDALGIEAVLPHLVQCRG